VNRSARALLVWLHVITSVGWMSMALVLFTLFVSGVGGGSEARRSAYTMADVVDRELLASLGNAAAFTGIMLAALTPWGFFRHWWVLVKFAITITQLGSGVFILSPNLADAVVAAAQGRDLPDGAFVARAGAALMASAIAFQAWVSVAKPWGRTPWAARSNQPNGPTWVYWLAIGVPPLDYALGAMVGAQPMPMLELLIVLLYPIWRYRRFHSGRCDQRHVREDSVKTSVGRG
jgi:hypothetical protein